MAFEYLKVFTGRRFGFDYISPAVCEAEFSSSGSPFISLLPITRATVSGPVMEAQGLGFRFSWGTVFGALCYSVYKAVDDMDPFGPYTLIAECITDTFLDLADPGLYKVVPITPDGLGDPSEPIHTPSAAAGGIPAPDHWWAMESFAMLDSVGGVPMPSNDISRPAFEPAVVANGIRMTTDNGLAYVFMRTDVVEALRYPGAGVTVAGWFNFVIPNTRWAKSTIFYYTVNSMALTFSRVLSTGRFTLELYDNGPDAITATIDAPPLTDGWHFYRAWYDPILGKIRLQFDHGTILDADAPALTGPPNTVGQFIMGAGNDFGTGIAPFDIRFDETGLWFAVLSQADDAFLYNSGAGKTYPL